MQLSAMAARGSFVKQLAGSGGQGSSRQACVRGIAASCCCHASMLYHFCQWQLVAGWRRKREDTPTRKHQTRWKAKMANSRLARSTRPYTRLSTHCLVSLRLSNRRHGPLSLDSHPFTSGPLLAAAGRLSPCLHALAADAVAHRMPQVCRPAVAVWLPQLFRHTRLSACCQCVKPPSDSQRTAHVCSLDRAFRQQ